MSRSISQHDLHDCTLTLDDGVLEGASLFPFFDREGRTRTLMLTTSESAEIPLLAWRAGLVSQPRLRPLRVHVRRADLARASADADLASLWHFDPWWKLGAERYAAHPLVPALKDTNIPGHDPSLSRFWFDSDLGRVSGAATGESARFTAYSRSMLTTAAQKRRRGGEPGS